MMSAGAEKRQYEIIMTNDTTYHAYQVTASSSELQVTLDMARMHLRNEDLKYDDQYVEFIIRSAAANIEKQYGLALLTQTIAQYHSCFPCASDAPLLLRIAPLISVTSIQYVDSAGDTQTWSAAEYASGRYDNTAFIVPKVGYSWPSDLSDSPNAVTVTYQAGFGAKASSVPADIRSALLLMIGSLYENREDAPSTLPMASQNILLPYYRFSC